MELLLNLAWMMLALPAYWLWRREAGTPAGRRVSAAQCFLVLGCVLVLLFPVISASDDLHAVRAEMEDSSISKRSVRQAGSDKNSAWVNRLQVPPAEATGVAWRLAPEARLLEVSVSFVSLSAGSRVFHGGRAPPYSLLG